MKSTISSKSIKTEIDIYPCLKIYKEKESIFVVWFTERGIGRVVYTNGPYDIGYNHIGWNEHEFCLYDGEVTLSNN